MNASVGRWENVSVSLAYRLGERQVFARKLHGIANREHFTLQKPYSSLPDPYAEAGVRSDFYFYPAYPVSFEPERIAHTGNLVAYTPYTFKNYFIDMLAVGSFDSYLQTFSSKSRSTLLRKVRKFKDAAGGAIDFRVYVQPSEIAEFLNLARPLSDTTYQARLLDAGLPNTAEFTAQAMHAAEAGRVRAFLLFLKQEPVAYVFCFCDAGIVTYDYVGFAATAKTLSPGTVLQYLMLQFLFDDRDCRIFDFTEGEGAQKQFFGSDFRVCAKTYFLSRSWRNVWLVRLHHGLNRFVESAGELLERAGLKNRIRKLLRGA